jgi:nitrate/nitrite transporter NarK
VTALIGALAAPLWSHLADTRLGAVRVLVVSSAATALFALALPRAARRSGRSWPWPCS